MAIAIQTTRMTKDQIADSGAVLARAFYDDPLMSWVIPDDATRLAKLTWFMGLAAKYGHNHGEVETTEGQVAGNAIWLPPGKTDVPALQMMLPACGWRP